MTTWSHKSPAALDIGGGALVVAAAWLVFYLVATLGGIRHNETRQDESRQYMVSPDISWNNQNINELPVQKFHDMTFVFSDDDGDPTPSKSWRAESTVLPAGPVKRAAQLQEDR